MRRWVKIAIGSAVLIAVILGLTPFLVNANTFRPKIENELTSTLGRKVTLGHLSVSLFTGGLVADDISISDDPEVSTTPFLEAKELDLGVEVWPFLLHRTVQIDSLTVDSPSIHLIHEQNGTWNFSSMGNSAAQPALPQQSSLPVLMANEVRIKNGSATVTTLPVVGSPFTCTDINLTVKQFSFTAAFPFDLSVQVPGDGSLALTGNAGPISQSDAAKTPFQAKLEIKHFDPIAANVIEKADGVSTVADLTAQISSDGTNLTSNGQIVATKLQLARGGSPTPQAVNIDFALSDNLATRAGQVTDVAIHTGAVETHLTGTYQMTAQGMALALHLAAPNLPVDQLEDLLPAAGVKLPSGSKLSGGTLSATLTITGPASATTISGPVEIDNTELAGFDLGSKIQGINPFGGTKGGTKIEKLSTTVTNSAQGTQFGNIYASLPQIGTATGSGAVSSADALDFSLTATFNNASILGSVANAGISAVGVLLGGGVNKAADNGIPLTITGTTSNPSIKANLGAMMKKQVGGGEGIKSSATKTLKGLFGH